MFSYTIKNNKIYIPTHPDFNAKHIIECGQVFRYKITDFGYEVYSLNHKASVYCQKDTTIIKCDDAKYFINYFDLNTNYAKIKLQLQHDLLVKQAIQLGRGIRILKQDPLETIIGFIISANNNLGRIKNTMQAISESYGTNMGNYYAFPTIEQLNTIPKEFFKSAGAGYRDQYLVNAIKQVKNGFDLQKVYLLPTKQVSNYLQQLAGVGPKVADCIMLYGYGITDSFPTDTWIKKVYYDYHPTALSKKVSATKMREFFVGRFGDLSGYAQQYLFYGKREN